jgi:hypothetical protein
VDDGVEAELIVEAGRLAESGRSVDEMIRFLRDSGADAGDCIWIMFKSGKFSLVEAKRVVLNSPVWADIREASIALQEAVIREVLNPPPGGVRDTERRDT